MANALFDYGREGFLAGDIDWDANNLKVVLLDTTVHDTIVVATDQFLSDINVGARIATSGNLASKTVTGGVADAADVTLTSVTGDTVESLVIYQDTGVEATSRLIVFIDTATGLVLTPDGGNVTITWDSGANKIFKL